MEDVGEGEPARPRGKTNSKKEDKRDAATNTLIVSVNDMINNDSREEECRRFKAEQMDAFMEIQRRRLEMKAEKQAKMLEMETQKQAKILEIEAANAKTKEKEVALASMMTGVKIMKVDLIVEEEAIVREDAGRHAQIRRRVIYGGKRNLFCMSAGVLA